MKYTVLHIVILLAFTFSSLAQNNIAQIEQLLTDEKEQEAQTLIDQTIRTDSTNAKLYFYKALILQNQLSIDLASEEKKVLLEKINQNLRLSLQYDLDQRLAQLQREEFITLKHQYLYTGMDFFNEKKYTLALELFEENLSLSALPIVQELDTMVWLNAAIAAEKCSEFEKAEFYYSNIIRHSKDAWQAYISLANVYKLQSKEADFFKTLKEAEAKFPEKQLYFNDEIISYYLENKKYKACIQQIDASLKTDSLNYKLFYLKGSILQELNKNEQAITAYQNTLKINPNNTDAAFNIAVIYYNLSIEVYKKGKLKRKEKKFVKSSTKQALNYLLLVHKAEPDNINVLKMIHSCYTILKMKKEQDIYETKINTIKK